MKNISTFISVFLFVVSTLGVFAQNIDKTNTPVVYIIGDSTVKNGQDKGDRGQWGWGHFLPLWFDTDKISFENHAIGGRSSRSFIREGRWDNVLALVKKGDYVIIQFGHNDGGELNSGRARASLSGIGDDFKDIVYENADDKDLEGKSDRVFTYGYYLRKYIKDVKQKGATPIICSLVPRNRWENGTLIRDEKHAVWAKQVATREKVYFLDLNKYVGDIYTILGEVIVKDYFSEDHTHTSLTGAMLNAKSVAELIGKQKKCALKKYMKYQYNQK